LANYVAFDIVKFAVHSLTCPNMQQQLRTSSTRCMGVPLHSAKPSMRFRPAKSHYNRNPLSSGATGSAAAEVAMLTSSQAQQWHLYACRMPLVGLGGVADAFKGTPVAKLLQLHTYLLLEAPDQVSSLGLQQCVCMRSKMSAVASLQDDT
jgi:hypothetical protein